MKPTLQAYSLDLHFYDIVKSENSRIYFNTMVHVYTGIPYTRYGIPVLSISLAKYFLFTPKSHSYKRS